MTEPLSFPIDAVRVSHCVYAEGVFPLSNRAVKCLGKAIPALVPSEVLGFNPSIFALRSTESWPMSFYSSPELTDSVILPQYVVLRQEIYLYGVC